MSSQKKRNNSKRTNSSNSFKREEFGSVSIENKKSHLGLIVSIIGLLLGSYYFFNNRIEQLEDQMIKRMDENHILRIDHGNEVNGLRHEIRSLNTEIFALKREINNLSLLLQSCQNKS